MFTIDWDRQQVTCPQGRPQPQMVRARPGGRDGFTVAIPRRDLPGLPGPRPSAPPQPARAGSMFLRPREIHDAVTALRASQNSQQWKDRYAIRAGVEGTIRQATAVTGIRTARYRGLPKTSLEHAVAATAINLIRLDAWHTSKALDRTRTTHLQRLTLAA